MFDDIIKNNYDCKCGHIHTISLKKIVCKENALELAPGIIAEFSKNNKVAMVCDDNTYIAAGKTLEEKFDFYQIIKLDSNGLHANEKGVEMLLNAVKPDTDLFVAVGSGTIHDITRYVAAQKNIDFVSVPTAPSVDGFVSTVAAMTWNGAKKTLSAVAPIAMVADLNIIACAPQKLIAAGVGDMIGKYTSLLDWKIANLVSDEYICDYLIGLEEEAIKKVASSIDKISLGDKEAIGDLFYGLVLSGLAMQMCGNSRPASGSEHHISHFIEMGAMGLESEAYHGEKVGVGLALACDKYKEMASLLDNTLSVNENYQLPKDEINNIFGPLSGEVFIENENDCLSMVDIKRVSECIEEIKGLIDELPSGTEIREMLKKVNAPYTLEDIGVASEYKEKILRFSPFVRNRLTFMRLLHLFEAV